MGGLGGGNIKILNKSLLLFQKRAFFTRKKQQEQFTLCTIFLAFPANICFFKVNNENTRKRFETCSKLTIKTPEELHQRRSGVFFTRTTTLTPLVSFWCSFASTYYAAAGTQPRKHLFKASQKFQAFNRFILVMIFSWFAGKIKTELINDWSEVTLKSETISGDWKSFEYDENVFFYFNLKALFVLKIFQFLFWIFFRVAW